MNNLIFASKSLVYSLYFTSKELDSDCKDNSNYGKRLISYDGERDGKTRVFDTK